MPKQMSRINNSPGVKNHLINHARVSAPWFRFGGLLTQIHLTFIHLQFKRRTDVHTHSRRLDYHPHVHVVMPAASIVAGQRLWRIKTSKGHQSYLFNHNALAKVFRAKLLSAIREAGLDLPACYPKKWVVESGPSVAATKP
jgi:hypothetical protein